jgi:hypothetical protein
VRRVHLHVDELVLRGVAFEDRRRVAAAIERELARRLSIPGAIERLTSIGHVDRVAGARVTVASEKPAEIGRAAGRGIADALAPGNVAR